MTPEEEEQVRRALAATAAAERPADGERVPPEVAARLDDVLAELVEGRRPAAERHAGLGDLAARRRTARRWPGLLVAAAAVVVVVGAGGIVAHGGFGSGGSGQSASSAGGSAQDKSAPQDLAVVPSDPALHRDGFAAEVRRLAGSPALADGADGSPPPSTGRGAVCARPDAGPGDAVLPVTLDGQPATLVLGPVTAGTRVAQVHSCDDPGRVLLRQRVRDR